MSAMNQLENSLSLCYYKPVYYQLCLCKYMYYMNHIFVKTNNLFFVIVLLIMGRNCLA